MSRFVKLSLTLATVALTGWAGCSESSTGGGGGNVETDVLGGDVDFNGQDIQETPDTSTPEPDTHVEDMYVPPVGNTVLDFVNVKGDDDAPCKGSGRCAIFMSINGSRSLEVMATRDGAPVESLEVAWEITKNPNDSLALGSKSSYTGSDGKTQTTVNQVAQAVEQYEVKVTIRNSDATPIYFDVIVTPKGLVPLIVAYSYTGKRNFQAITTYLFKHTNDKPHPCSGINPNQVVGADLSHPPTSLTQTASFKELPDLETEINQTYTIVGVGKDVSGPTQVWGCEEGIEVTYTGSKNVKIDLMNLPPKWAGKDFDLTTQFDLVSALPDNVEGIVNTVLGFFTDPAGQLLVLVCDVGGSVGAIYELCDFVFNDADNPCLEPEEQCFGSVGIAIKSLVTGLLNDLLADNVAGDIFFTGQDVAKILKELELKATVRFLNEPKDDGTFSKDDIKATWHTVRYRWTLGTNCDPGDYNCGWRDFNLAAFQDGVIEAPFSGNVVYTADDEYRLNIDQHSLDINYGSLLLYLIEKQLLPIIGGDGSDGTPKVDSFEEYIKSLIAGKECLVEEQVNGTQDACCEAFAVDISGGSTGIGYSVAFQGCKLALPLAQQELSKLLTGLDLDTGEAFTLATKMSCQCFDADANLTIDAWGSQENPCVWDTQLNFGSTTVNIDNVFWAVEQQ